MQTNNEFIPFGNNLRVLPDKADTILKTDTFCEHGKVVAIGELVKDIKVGDEISFWIFGIKDVDHNGVSHKIIPCDDRFILELKKNG